MAATKNKKRQTNRFAKFKLQIVKGFKKTVADDNSCFWYSKDIKHKFLEQVEVCIQEDPRGPGLCITVYCNGQGDDADLKQIVVFEVPYNTELDLIKLLDWLQNDKG